MIFWFKYYARCFPSPSNMNPQTFQFKARSVMQFLNWCKIETTMKVTEWGDIKTSQENYLWRNQRVMRRSSPAVLTK
jgi:hypothetical protein